MESRLANYRFLARWKEGFMGAILNKNGRGNKLRDVLNINKTHLEVK